MMHAIPFRANIPIKLQKVLHASDERGVYITLEASDTLVDYQRDRMDFRVLEKFAQSAREGKVKLRRSHSDPFFIGTSVDGKVIQTPDNRFVLSVTFKAEDTGAGYYPEILHLIKMFKEYGEIPMQASVGGWITGYETIMEKGEIIRIIKDAEIEHVALTPPDGAVNPRTRVVEVLVKSFVDAITQYEKEHQIGIEPKIVGEDNMEKQIRQAQIEEERPTVDVKKLMKELERCAIERRRMFYTKQDVEQLSERARKYGINPSPLGNIVKPEVYLDYDNFADPVNYLFPLEKGRIEAGIEFARTHPTLFLSLYDPVSAAKVYTNLVKAALEQGIPVKFSSTPADALLPEEIASQLEGFNSDTYSLLKSWIDASHEYYMRLVSGLYDDTVSVEDNQALLLAKLEERSKKFNYPPAPNAKLVPHKLFAKIPLSKFADPVGFNFPITPEWVLFSYRAFRYTPVRHLYTPEAQRFIYARILKGLENIGALIPFDPEFELNRVFAKHPVFVGAEDYEEDVIHKSKSQEAPAFFTTQSALIATQNLTKTLEEFTEEQEKETEEQMPLTKSTGDAVTAAEAPQFPFVIGAKFVVPKGAQAGYVKIHPNLIRIDPREMKAQEMPALALLVGTKLIQTLGLDKVPELLPSGDVKLKWVGPKEAKTPIVVLPDSKLPEGKQHEAGFKIIGGLQALHKGDVIAEWFVDSKGNVYEVNYIGFLTPMLLNKSREAILDVGKHIERALQDAGLVRNATPYIVQVGTRFVVWSANGDYFITPVRIKETGEIEVLPVKVPAMHAYVPDISMDPDAASAILGAIVLSVAKVLGEDHEWVKETIAELTAEDLEEEVEEEWEETEERREEEEEEEVEELPEAEETPEVAAPAEEELEPSVEDTEPERLELVPIEDVEVEGVKTPLEGREEWEDEEWNVDAEEGEMKIIEV